MNLKSPRVSSALRFAAIGIVLLFAVAPSDAKDRARIVSPGDLETHLVSDVQGPYTLTVEIDGLRNSAGNIDLLVFDQAEGWPDEIPYSIRKFEFPAVQGNMLMKVPNLPEGDYAVIVVHDENMNRRIDKDWRGVPIEQWGMSNNPRVYMTTPAYHRAKFHMPGDMEIHVPMKLYP